MGGVKRFIVCILIMSGASATADDFFPEEKDVFFSRDTYDTIPSYRKKEMSFSEWILHLRVIAKERGSSISHSQAQQYRGCYESNLTPLQAYERCGK